MFMEPNSAPSWNIPELAADLVQLARAELHDVPAVDPDLAALELQQAHDVLEEHGLACAEGPEHEGDLPLGDVAGDVLEDGLRSERLRQAADRDLDSRSACEPSPFSRPFDGSSPERGSTAVSVDVTGNPPRPHPRYRKLAGCQMGSPFVSPPRNGSNQSPEIRAREAAGQTRIAPLVAGPPVRDENVASPVDVVPHWCREPVGQTGGGASRHPGVLLRARVSDS